MKKIHLQSLKLHTIFNVIVWMLYLAVILICTDATLVVSVVFLLIYITGNGLIHSRKNQLSRDTLVEYVILSLIALIILADALIK
jgi:hypothetical protein